MLVGDLIEVEVFSIVFFLDGILQVQLQQLIYVGLIKMVLGYIEGIVGVVVLIKVLLVFQYGLILLNMYFNQFNFKIEFFYYSFQIFIFLGEWLVLFVG